MNTPPREIASGTYKDINGVDWLFSITLDTDRMHGLREWARKALANGGRAEKANGALAIELNRKATSEHTD